MTKKKAFITEKQWHMINGIYQPIVIKNIRDGYDRFRYWRAEKNGLLIFDVAEHMWRDREWEWLLTADESIFSEIMHNT